MIRFEEDEYMLLAMFKKESRQAAIDDIHRVIPYIGGDEEVIALINGTLEKLRLLSDEAFLNLNLEAYQQEPEEDE